jgi:hypothetical protein
VRATGLVERQTEGVGEINDERRRQLVLTIPRSRRRITADSTPRASPSARSDTPSFEAPRPHHMRVDQVLHLRPATSHFVPWCGCALDLGDRHAVAIEPLRVRHANPADRNVGGRHADPGHGHMKGAADVSLGGSVCPVCADDEVVVVGPVEATECGAHTHADCLFCRQCHLAAGERIS